MTPVIGHPPSGPNRIGDNTTSTSSEGTTITAGGTAHTNGSWTEVLASVGFDTYGITVVLAGTAVAAANQRVLVDVGIGAGGSEQVLLPKLNAGGLCFLNSASGNGAIYYFPIYIPAASRLSARAQASTASDTVTVALTLHRAPIGREFWVGSKVTAYGISGDPDSDSMGVSVTGGSTNAYGTDTQIVASTTNPIRALQIGLDMGTDTSGATLRGMLRIGVGSTPDYLASGLLWKESTTLESIDYNMANMVLSHMRFSIPSGTRLTTALMTSGTGEARGVILYGVS